MSIIKMYSIGTKRYLASIYNNNECMHTSKTNS